MRYGTGTELKRQLHPPVCTLAGVGERLNLILHWLAYIKVKSEVTSGEAFWVIP